MNTTCLKRGLLTALLAHGGLASASLTPPSNPTTRDFTLSVPPSVTLQSGKSAALGLHLTRPENPAGHVALSLEGADVGNGSTQISATFGADGQVLTLGAGAEVSVGPHLLTLRGRNGDAEHTAQITVNVERWLLVDDDRSANNWPANRPDAGDSNADTLARSAMQAAGKTFEVKVVPYSGSGQDKDEPSGPDAQALSRYSGVVWYTGNTTVHPLTEADGAALSAFLDTANRRVVLLSPGFVRDAAASSAAPAAPRELYRPLVTDLMGVDKLAFPGAAGFTLTGEAGTVMSGVKVNVAGSVRGVLQPGPQAQALLREGGNVIASGRKLVGAGGSSRVVLAAFSWNHLAGPGDAATLLQRFMAY